jgi:hypothetical protein
MALKVGNERTARDLKVKHYFAWQLGTFGALPLSPVDQRSQDTRKLWIKNSIRIERIGCGPDPVFYGWDTDQASNLANELLLMEDDC